MTLLAVVVGVPVVFLRFTYDPFNVPKISLLAIGVAVAGIAWLFEMSQRRGSFGGIPLLVPATALTVALAVSWLFSPYKAWAVLGFYPRFQGLLPYLLFVLLGILLAITFRERADELATAFVWAGALVGAYTVIQVVGADPFSWSLAGTPTSRISTTGNPNFTGGFLAITLAVAVALALSDEGRRKTTIRLLIPLVAGWVLAGSQGGWAGGVAGASVVAGSHFATNWTWSRTAGLLVAAVCVVVVVGAVVFSTVAPTARFTDASFVVRGRWWSAASDMALASPIVGRGPNSFAIEGVSHRTTDDAIEFGYDFPDDPHSVPLSFSANLGLLGLAAYLTMLVWTLARGVGTPSTALLQIGFFGGAIAYFVQSLVSIDEPVLRSGLWVTLAGMTTLPRVKEKVGKKKSPARTGRSTATSRRSPLIPASVGVGIAAGMLVVAVLAITMFLQADARMLQARNALRQGDLQQGTDAARQTLDRRDEPAYSVVLATRLKVVVLSEDNTRSDFSSLHPLYEQAVRAFAFVDELPFVFSMTQLADLLDEWALFSGEPVPQRALDLYAEAMRIDPKNPLIRAGYADALIHADEDELAFEITSEQQALVGARYPEFWGVLALSAARVGETEVARDAVAQALALDPSEPSATEAAEILEGPQSP